MTDNCNNKFKSLTADSKSQKFKSFNCIKQVQKFNFRYQKSSEQKFYCLNKRVI